MFQVKHALACHLFCLRGTRSGMCCTGFVTVLCRVLCSVAVFACTRYLVLLVRQLKECALSNPFHVLVCATPLF